MPQTMAEAIAYGEALVVYGREVWDHHLPLVIILLAVGVTIGCWIS